MEGHVSSRYQSLASQIGRTELWRAKIQSQPKYFFPLYEALIFLIVVFFHSFTLNQA